MTWEQLSSEIVYDGWFQVLNDQLKRPDGKIQDFAWVPSGGGAAVLALDDQDNVILTRQYRHPLGRTILDLPAGHIHEGEMPADAAGRELREETGYTASTLTELGAYYQAPGLNDMTVTVFEGRGLVAGQAEPDERELIEVVLMPWARLLELVLGDGPVDGALAYAVLLRHAKTHPG